MQQRHLFDVQTHYLFRQNAADMLHLEMMTELQPNVVEPPRRPLVNLFIDNPKADS